MIRSLGIEEARDIIRECELLDATCEFCNALYRFDSVDVELLFTDDRAMQAASTRH